MWKPEQAQASSDQAIRRKRKKRNASRSSRSYERNEANDIGWGGLQAAARGGIRTTLSCLGNRPAGWPPEQITFQAELEANVAGDRVDSRSGFISRAHAQGDAYMKQKQNKDRKTQCMYGKKCIIQLT